MTLHPMSATSPAAKQYSGWQVAFFVLLAIVLTALVSVVLVYRQPFPQPFTPVELSAREQQTLDAKLQQLDSTSARTTTPLEPEAYREDSAARLLNFNERELNALLANNADMAERFAVDLSNDLASAKLLVPVPADFPFLGGKTVQVNAGLNVAYTAGRPVVVLQGVSLWGVPIPSAWMGGLKNVDLVKEFGGTQGFWQAFADGVESIEINDGELKVQLKE